MHWCYPTCAIQIGASFEIPRSSEEIRAPRAADPDPIAGADHRPWHRPFRLCTGATRHARFRSELPLRSPDHPKRYAHLARLILILSLAPTIGLGIGRFAYALVLPDMRDSDRSFL